MSVGSASRRNVGSFDIAVQCRFVRHRGATAVRSTSRRMIDAFDITA